MIQKSATWLALILLLVSCDKKQEAETQGTAQLLRRTTRVDRPSRDVPETRDKLRGAFEDAKAKAPGEEREVALAQVARNALDTSPDIASEAIKEMLIGSDQKLGLIKAYMRKLLEEGRTEDAVAWADALGNEKDTSVASSLLAELVSASNPEQAANMLSATSFTAAGVDPSADQVLQNWVATNPTRAAEWATRLPAGEARKAGLKSLLTSWINSDTESALSWASSQRNTITRQDAVDAVVASMVELPEPIRNAQLEKADENFQQEIGRRISEITQAAASEQEAESPQEPESTAQPEPER